MKIKRFYKIMASLLSSVLIINTIPSTIYAESRQALPQESINIISFATLDGNVAEQTVAYGRSLSGLDLPSTLTATVRLFSNTPPTAEEPDSSETGGDQNGAEATEATGDVTGPEDDLEVTDDKTEPKDETRPKDKTESKDKTGPKNETGPKEELSPEEETKPEGKTESEGKTEPESKAESENKDEPEGKTESKHETEPEGDSEADPLAALFSVPLSLFTLLPAIEVHAAEPNDGDLETVEIITEQDIPVEWISTPTYHGDEPGKYLFTATVTEPGFFVSAEPPSITVTVNESGEPTVIFTITGESEYSDALYLDAGVTVTDEDLLEGVSAEDENGEPVDVSVSDIGELNLTDPQPGGTPDDPQPYTITYEAEHPASGEVFTQTRDCYVTPGMMMLTSVGGNIDLNDTVTESGDGWSYNKDEKVFTITGGTIVITGTVDDGTCVVVNGTASITLDNVGIDCDEFYDLSPFLLNNGAEVNLSLIGANSLTGGYGCAGLQASDVTTLTITSEGAGSLTASSPINGAGIGGGSGGPCGTITINGKAKVKATGSSGGAGIGGGFGGSGGTITISGDAEVEATGDRGSAGIGGGSGGSGGTITISGNAKVEATGDTYGAGIGGGTGGDGGQVTIDGGTVTAGGGNFAAGIGGGLNGSGGTITISGNAKVKASALSSGAGIGGGYAGDGGSVSISGDAEVEATGGYGGAGIGGGDEGSGGTITISGDAEVKATGGYDGAGIGGGYAGSGGTITINGGRVTANGENSSTTGIGGGNGGGSGTFHMNGNGVVFASSVSDTGGKTQGILWNGNAGQVYGHVTLTKDLEIPEKTTLHIPEAASLTIDDITLTNNGIIKNNGTFTNNGTIENENEGKIEGGGAYSGDKIDQAPLIITDAIDGAMSMTFGDKFTLEVTGGSGMGSLIFESGDTSMAVIDEITGWVKIVGAKNTTTGVSHVILKVSKEGDQYYKDASPVSVTIDVSPAFITVATQNRIINLANKATQTVDIADLLKDYKDTNDILNYSVDPSHIYGDSDILAASSTKVTTDGKLSFALANELTQSDTDKTVTIPVEVDAFRNYDMITVYVVVKVTDKIPAAVTIPPIDKVYDGSAVTAQASAQTAPDGAPDIPSGDFIYTWMNDTGQPLAGNQPPVNGGKYQVTAQIFGDSAATYVGETTIHFEIIRKDVTVKADDKTAKIGETLPTPTLSYTGFVGTDNENNAFSVPAEAMYDDTTDTSIAGTFDIYITEGIFNERTSANYILLYEHGYLVVTKPVPPAGGGSSSSGGGNGGSSSNTTPSAPAGRQPNLPTPARSNATGTVTDGMLSVIITDQMAKNALDSVTDKRNGVAVQFQVTGTGSTGNTGNTVGAAGGTSSLTATFERAALERLKEAGVEYVRSGSTLLDVTLDLKAVETSLAQTSGNVTVSAVNYHNLPGTAKTLTGTTKILTGTAKTLIGNRPVYDITVKDENGRTVSDLQGGTATISIPYTPAPTEQTGNLYGVYLPANNKPQLITGSGYTDGKVIIRTDHLSVYGVGYKAPATAFTDTADHWAKDDIDFAASRGLINGTKTNTSGSASGTSGTSTTGGAAPSSSAAGQAPGTQNPVFYPDTAITRADFIMALGKLSGVDVSGFKQSSFSDIPNNSPYMPYMEWALASGIINSTGNINNTSVTGTINNANGSGTGIINNANRAGTGNIGNPDAAVTREEMAFMLIGYARTTGFVYPAVQRAVTFTDTAAIHASAKAAVTTMQQAGIMTGRGNQFAPKAAATRAEAAAYLHRYVLLSLNGSN